MTTFDETSKIWKGKKVPISYQRDIHISEIILKNLKKTPSRVLQIYDENGAQMTCDELRLNATRVAQNLTNIGIKQGDVVGFNCSSSENICALLHGCIFIGAIINPMALKQDKSDLIHMWSQTQPKFIFCDAEVYEKVVEALNQMNNNAVVCTLIKRIDNAMFVDDFLATTGNEKSFEPLKNDNSEDSLILLSSSSGTTGPAKAVRIPQSYILLLADMLSVEMRLLNFTPMFWYLSLLLFIILPLTKLTRVVTRRLESVENCLELVEKFKVEQLYASPALLNKIIQYPFIETANLSSLKIVTSGGATVHPDLRIKFKQTFPGKRLLAVYGTTEMVFVEPLLSDENEGHTVGRPFPNSEIKIVDDNGNNLGIDESGEICAKPMFSFSVRFMLYLKVITTYNQKLSPQNRDITENQKLQKLLLIKTISLKLAILAILIKTEC